MTDITLLKQKIDNSGYKKQYIASRIGVTYQGLLNKLDGKSEFKACEIESLGKILNLEGPEVISIFFAGM